MPDFGDVRIGGKDYRIDLASYRVRDLADFSPRAATPGNSITYSELLLYQPLSQIDWRHGFGFHWYTDAMGYMRTEGFVDTRYAGIATLSTFPQTTTVSGYEPLAADFMRGAVTFKNKTYIYGSQGLFEVSYSGGATTITNIPTVGTAINCALVTNDYLFYCPDGERLQKFDGTTHSDAGQGANSTDYKWMTIHNGFVFAGKDNTNQVYYGSEPDLSDLHGDPADDTVEINVGIGTFPTLRAVSYAGKLIIARPDGLWEVGDDKAIARNVVSFAAESSTLNFNGMAVFNGQLVFPIKGKIYMWNGVRLTDITPPRVTDLYPYVAYGHFSGFVVIDGFLYVIGRISPNSGNTDDGTFFADLLTYDGVGWAAIQAPRSSTHESTYTVVATNSQPYSSVNDDHVSITGYKNATIAYDPFYRRLWQYGVGGIASLGYTTISKFSTQVPQPPFPTSAQYDNPNSLLTSRLDMGFRRVTKSSPSLLVEASNMEMGETHMKVYYMLDGSGEWVYWNDITENGVTELTYPGGNYTVEYKYIQLRIDFIAYATTQAPVLEGLTLRFLMRPNVFFGFNFNVVAATNYVYGQMQDGRSSYSIIDELRVMRDSKSPLDFVDIHGIQRKVYISALSETAVERHTNEELAGIPDIETVVNVNLTEAK